jgi:hypothetical protein
VLTPAIRDEISRLGRADIMVGIPSFKNAATIGYVVRAAQAGLVQYFPDLKPVVVNSDAGSPDGTQRVVVDTEPPDYIEQILLVRPTNKLDRVSLTYPEIDGTGGKGAALRTIFEIAAALEVQALVVVDSTCARSCPSGSSSSPGRFSRVGMTSSPRCMPATSTTGRSRTRSPIPSPALCTATGFANPSAATSASPATSFATT